MQTPRDLAADLVAAVADAARRLSLSVAYVAVDNISHALGNFIDDHSKMIDPFNIPVAARDQIQSGITIANRDGRSRPALARRFEAEHGFVEFAQHGIARADDGHMIDLREHCQSLAGQSRSPR